MKTLLCCIGRHENQYIKEFVEYYMDLGFTNICLFDNNYNGEEHFEDVIGEYIESGYVILKDYRNRKVCQLDAYNECYNEYKKEYDWIAFFDCDEFLTFTIEQKIEGYLSNDAFMRYDAIKFNWMCYGDNDLLTNDGTGVLNRFNTPIPLNKHVQYDFPENYHTKCMIRGGLSDVKFALNPHTTNLLMQCGPNGEKLTSPTSPFMIPLHDTAYLRHYSTKTVEEYCDKMKRGFPDRLLYSNSVRHFVKIQFFGYNAITKEKIKIIKSLLGVDMSLFFYKKRIINQLSKFFYCPEKVSPAGLNV